MLHCCFLLYHGWQWEKGFQASLLYSSLIRTGIYLVIIAMGSVLYVTIPGTATAESDYVEPLSRKLTFPTSVGSQTLRIDIINDQV